jgi:hypothetical protein
MGPRFLILCEGDGRRKAIRSPRRRDHSRFQPIQGAFNRISFKPMQWRCHAPLPPLYIAQDRNQFLRIRDRERDLCARRSPLPLPSSVEFAGRDDGGADVTVGNTRRGKSEAETGFPQFCFAPFILFRFSARRSDRPIRRCGGTCRSGRTAVHRATVCSGRSDCGLPPV